MVESQDLINFSVGALVGVVTRPLLTDQYEVIASPLPAEYIAIGGITLQLVYPIITGTITYYYLPKIMD